jgi:tRNA modification GTPase
MAEPGEFTYRAFINGKMDLVQAESVNDLICACSSRAIRLAQEQRDGHLSQSFQEIYNLMLSIAADLEASLNFSDAELPPTVFSDILSGLELARHKIADLLKNWQAGHYIRNGISMVIAGRPNVGKSSLLNALTGRNRVIVSHYPGTTRDIIEESFVMDGICIRLFDTAGLRTAECEIEVEGIRRAYAKLQQADFILYVLDASQDLTDEDISIIQTLPVQRSLLIINKVDLGNAIFKDNLSKFCTVETSLLLSTGIDNVKKEIAELLSKNIHLDSLPHTIISDRHFHLLSRVEHTLIDGITTLCSTGEQALAVHHVRLAISILGEITGNDVSDDILSSVFSKFCIGK